MLKRAEQTRIIWHILEGLRQSLHARWEDDLIRRVYKTWIFVFDFQSIFNFASKSIKQFVERKNAGPSVEILNFVHIFFIVCIVLYPFASATCDIHIGSVKHNMNTTQGRFKVCCVGFEIKFNGGKM
jgi:hypothetical protein